MCSFRVMAALCLLCSIFGLAMVPRRERAATNQKQDPSTATNQKQDPSSATNQKQDPKKPFNYSILATPTFVLVFIGRLKAAS